MPEGRFLSKSVAHDLELNTVSLEADYLFTRCIPHLDREGRMPGHPSQVKGMACPMRRELTEQVVDRALGELAAAGLVAWYEVDGRPILEFPGFDVNQKGLRKDREAESRLQPPTTVGAQQLRTYSGSTPDPLPPSEVKVSQGKLSKEKNIGQSPDVENSVARLHAIAEDLLAPPPEQPPPKTLTVSELEELAAERLGLRILPKTDLATNHRLLKEWAYGSGRDLEEIEAAILGLADMVAKHRPEVSDWLHPGVPITLKALQHTNTLYDQGDGKAQRPLWDVAVEHFRSGHRAPPAKRGGEPRRLKIQDPAA